MNLTPTQIAAIDRHLRQDNWLLNDALIAELTDHYAIAVAEKMATGIVFDIALIDVQESFGGMSGLADLEIQFVRTSNKAAWKAYKAILFRYLLPPRSLFFVALGYGFYWLISPNWLLAFLLLYVPVIVISILIGLPFNKRTPEQWKFDWNTRPWKGYYQRRFSGNILIYTIVATVAGNIPLYVFLGLNPFSYTKPFDSSFPVTIAVAYTVSLWALATIAELTYRQNPVLKRFAKPA